MTEGTVVDLQGILRRARALVFDFDGTLVDSNEIKWRGFEAAFADAGDRREEILAYCRESDSLVRGDKFRHVYEQMLQLPYAPEVDATLHARFAAATTSAIVAAPEIPGASAFLRGLSGRLPTAILSSTPHEILLQIINERKWRDLVRTVRGAPLDKAAWLRAFRHEHSLQSDQVVFFGDSEDDARAANHADCTFVGVANRKVDVAGGVWIEEFWPLIFRA